MYFLIQSRSIIYMHVHVFNILFLSFIRPIFVFFFVVFHSVSSFVYFEIQIWILPIDEYTQKKDRNEAKRGKSRFALHAEERKKGKNRAQRFTIQAKTK